MTGLEKFYDLLFEVSNEYRHRMLLLLQGEAMRVTDLSKELGLTSPEISRHISRLSENVLVSKDVEGLFHITPFGSLVLVMLQEFEFASKHSDYFVSHLSSSLPEGFVKRIGDLSESTYSDSIPDFFRQIERIITEAEEEVSLLVDQFPLNHIHQIVEAVERGVKFKIIEPTERVLNPDLDAITGEDSRIVSRAKLAPSVEQRMLDNVDFYMYMSEKSCVSSFPTLTGKNEYKGFLSTDEKSLGWCRDLFQHYWGTGVNRSLSPSTKQVTRGEISETLSPSKQIVVVGSERPEIDAQAIQDAVDNYDEVILKGRFNIGASSIYINRSVILRGEGRKDDIPDTKIWKKGWTFPFLDDQIMFRIRGEGIDVTIENIHVEDFNGTCIGGSQQNSLTIRKNRITLQTGLGRGLSFGPWGDHVVGIGTGGESMSRGGSPGGVLIEDNYLDFALSFSRGYTTNMGLERDPEYRPDLRNHEAPICVGIILNRNLGKVVVRNNIIRNMSSRGILLFDNWDTADIKIENNTIVSDIYGAYPYNSPMSGVGILAQSVWSEPRTGGHVEITGNKISCEKVNYCGIAVHGPAMYKEGVGKLDRCIIRNNVIELKNGYVGVQINKSDNTEVIDNKISGKVYYALQVIGRKKREGIELGSNKNTFGKNDLGQLTIKAPDEYSDRNVDKRTFFGSDNRSTTAHVWLNKFSKENIISVEAEETVLDEGNKNLISR